jgi:hypothetical protein
MAQHRFDYADRAAAEATQLLNMNSSSEADLAHLQMGAYNLAVAVAHMSKGLSELATGLRATYLLLEEVKTRLDRQGPGAPAESAAPGPASSFSAGRR